MTACSVQDCWCSDPIGWPPVRTIASTGARYTVEELPSEGAVRIFRYAYLPPARTAVKETA